ncbi:MAG: hypothetical protein HYT83_02275 [Candidatus Levybacteria bacterium]|nr:hypothetical protein [Candidatus Levybacteria bacterium]
MANERIRGEIMSLVQTIIPIAGLRPEYTRRRLDLVRGGAQPEFVIREETHVGDNLGEKLVEVEQVVAEKPWLRKLLEDVVNGERSAVFIVTLGALVITTAVGAGYEFGVRGGRDLKELHYRLKEFTDKRRAR